MIFKIPIDRFSIKPNPDAGRTDGYFHGSASIMANIIITCRHVDADKIFEQARIFEVKTDEFLLSEASLVGDGTDMEIKINYFVAKEEAKRKQQINNFCSSIIEAGGKIASCEISDTRELHKYNYMPQASHFFDYVLTEVECSKCHERFLHTELESGEMYDGAGYSDEVCPECGTWDCCTLEFEQLEKEEA